MRNLKRALSLVLAALMLIGMMVVGAGAAGVDDFTDRDEIVNKDAVSMLTILGVINGKEDGSYYAPKDNVTRAEMAKMIATILNQGADVNDLYANMDTGLTDINNSWAKGYINYCYSLGIIAGRGNGIFDPTANVTGNEAAKMLLVAIGYNPDVEGLTGAAWAIKTTALASTLGIFDDLTAATSEPLTRDDAALVIYNALDVEMIQSYTANGYAIAYEDHRTLLSAKYGVYKVEGVVTANEWAELNQTDSDATAKTGKTTLENVVVYSSTTSNTTVGEGVAEREPVTFNVSTPVDMMGKAVTMYIKKTTILANSTVLGVTVNDSMNVIEGTVANENDVKDLLKGTGLSVDADTEYYVNYGYETAAQSAKLINNYDWNKNGAKFNVNGVDVKLIDNNNDGDVEYVLYIRETLSDVVRTSTKDETVTIDVPVVDANGILTASNGKTTQTQVVENADIVTDMALEADDVILYVQYGGRTYITEPEIVTGTMTRVDRDADDELYVTLDNGETYKQSYIREVLSQVDADVTRFEIASAKTDVGFSTQYDFILDTNGYIVAFRPVETKVPNYGLVLNSAWTQNALTKAGEVKILTTSNLEATYDIDWNGSRDAFKGMIFENGYTGDTSANLDAKLECYLGTRDVEQNSQAVNTLGAAIGTVIEYTLDEDNILTIENVFNLNDLDANGDLVAPADRDKANISIDEASEEIAYVGASDKADGRVVANTPNLQYTLRSDYENGDATLYVTANGQPKSFAVDKNTVAFYYLDSTHYGVATGWEEMGDVASNNNTTQVQVYNVIQKDGGQYKASNLADLVLFNADLTTNTADWMLVLNANAIDADTLELNVVFEDGTAEAITVDKDDYDNFFDNAANDAFMKAYKYSVDGKGEYTIDTDSQVIAVPASLLKNGTVDVNGSYLSITNDSKIWDVTDIDDAGETVPQGSFDSIKKWAVVIDTDNGNALKTAWVWDMDADTVFGDTYTFNWVLDNYENVTVTGLPFYDVLNIMNALDSGKNVRIVGDLDLGALSLNLNIPANQIVQVEGDFFSSGKNVTGAGTLRVRGDYVADTNITTNTQIGGNLVIPARVNENKAPINTYLTISSVVGVAGDVADDGYGYIAGTRNNSLTLAAGGELYVVGDLWVDTLKVYGHMDVYGDLDANHGGVYSTTTLIVRGNMTIGVDFEVGDNTGKAGSLTVGGDITGDGDLAVRNGTVTLTADSSVALNGTLGITAKGKLTQPYNSNKNIQAGTVIIHGTVSVPGDIIATAGDITIGSTAKVTTSGTLNAPSDKGIYVASGAKVTLGTVPEGGVTDADGNTTYPGTLPPVGTGDDTTALTSVVLTLTAPASATVGTAVADVTVTLTAEGYGADATEPTANSVVVSPITWSSDSIVEGANTYTFTLSAAEGYTLPTTADAYTGADVTIGEDGTVTVTGTVTGVSADSFVAVTVNTDAATGVSAVLLDGAEVTADTTVSKGSTATLTFTLDPAYVANVTADGATVTGSGNTWNIAVAEDAASVAITITTSAAPQDQGVVPAPTYDSETATFTYSYYGEMPTGETIKNTINAAALGVQLGLVNDPASDNASSTTATGTDFKPYTINLVKYVKATVGTTDYYVTAGKADVIEAVTTGTYMDAAEDTVAVSATITATEAGLSVNISEDTVYAEALKIVSTSVTGGDVVIPDTTGLGSPVTVADGNYVKDGTNLVVTTGTLTANKYYTITAGETEILPLTLAANTDAKKAAYQVKASDAKDGVITITQDSGYQVMLDGTLMEGLYDDNDKLTVSSSLKDAHFVVVTATVAHATTSLDVELDTAATEEAGTVVYSIDLGTFNTSTIKGVLTLEPATSVKAGAASGLANVTYTYVVDDETTVEGSGVALSNTTDTWFAQGAVLTVSADAQASGANERIVVKIGTADEYVTIDGATVGEDGTSTASAEYEVGTDALVFDVQTEVDLSTLSLGDSLTIEADGSSNKVIADADLLKTLTGAIATITWTQTLDGATTTVAAGTDLLVANAEYTATVVLSADEHYYLPAADDVTCDQNSNASVTVGDVTVVEGTEDLTFTISFTATEQA